MNDIINELNNLIINLDKRFLHIENQLDDIHNGVNYLNEQLKETIIILDRITTNNDIIIDKLHDIDNKIKSII